AVMGGRLYLESEPRRGARAGFGPTRHHQPGPGDRGVQAPADIHELEAAVGPRPSAASERATAPAASPRPPRPRRSVRAIASTIAPPPRPLRPRGFFAPAAAPKISAGVAVPAPMRPTPRSRAIPPALEY